MSELAVSTQDVPRSQRTKSTLPEAKGDFVRAFNDMRNELVNTLYFFLGNHEDAQDCAQETFVKCWKTQASLTDVQNFKAWIFRVGLNAAKDLQRNAWRRKSRPLGDLSPPERDGTPTAEGTAELKENRDRLQQALLELRPEEKEVFLLRQNADLTYEEIAELRRAPIGTVKTQMRSALAKLRKVLQETEA